MKKLVLLLAVAFSASLFSCGGDKAAETCDSCCNDTAVVAEVVDTTVVTVDTAAVDTAAVVK